MAGSKAIRSAEHGKPAVKYSSFVFASLAFMVIALIYVWCHIHITGLNYEMAAEMRVRDRLLEENRQLKIEIATLRSPGRIEAIARDKLKMHYPERKQVVLLK